MSAMAFVTAARSAAVKSTKPRVFGNSVRLTSWALSMVNLAPSMSFLKASNSLAVMGFWGMIGSTPPAFHSRRVVPVCSEILKGSKGAKMPVLSLETLAKCSSLITKWTVSS